MILNRKPAEVFRDVAKFTELAQPDMLVPMGQLPSIKAVELAKNLFKEEGIKEYLGAIERYQHSPSRENLVDVIDGAMDTIYVIAWAMRIMNVESQAYWNEVQRSNMAKFSKDGSEPVPLDLPEYKDVPCELNYQQGYAILRNADTGKIMKPEGWTPPNLHGVMQELEMIHRMRNQPDKVATTTLMEYFHTMEARKEKGEIEL